jgi:CDP-2,3-bis-(O-geranylgeranyl)-sn-glycerol synthase
LIDFSLIFSIVVLLLAANGLPIIARNLFQEKFEYPIDFGFQLPDHHPVFGTSKTWRGIIASILGTGILAYLMGFPKIVVTRFGVYVMIGDLSSSFVKRRMGLPESSKTRGLDIVPESLFPLIMLDNYLNINMLELIIIIGIFVFVEITISPVLYRLHIRKRPY